MPSKRKIELVEVKKLLHIEDFGRKRMLWLKDKILTEGVWSVPLKIDNKNSLVMDGQHRMEGAKSLDLKFVPCIKYSYDEVNVWSLRPNYDVTAQLVVERALMTTYTHIKQLNIHSQIPLILSAIINFLSLSK